MTIKIEKSGGKARFKANDQEFLVADEGNVGIGTDTPTAKLDVVETVAITESDEPTLKLSSTLQGASVAGDLGSLVFTTKNLNSGLGGVGATGIQSFSVGDARFIGMKFFTSTSDGGQERMRITNSGYLKADPSGRYVDAGGLSRSNTPDHFLSSASSSFSIIASNNNTGGQARSILSLLPEGDSNVHYEGRTLFDGNTSATQTFKVSANGNVQNINNSYGALSDIKLKENITDSTPKLDDIAAIRFVNYNLKSQPDTKQFGVIAQELEEIFPALVETTPDVDSEGNETGESTKSVKYSVLTLMAVKALQEANDKITALEERLAALEAGN